MDGWHARLKRREGRLGCVRWLLVLASGLVLPAQTPGSEQGTELDLARLLDLRVMTATKAMVRVREVPASVVVVTRNDIASHGYQSLQEILEDIPGMFVINDYSELGASFGVRGFWSTVGNSNTAVLVNGVSQTFDAYQSNALKFLAIPVEAIDRIEVVRGPMSVMYGQGAFFGAINIITNEACHLTMASASVGSQDTRRLFGRVSGSEGGLRFIAQGGATRSAGLDMPITRFTEDPAVLAAFNLSATDRTGGRMEWDDRYFALTASLEGWVAEFTHSENRCESITFIPSATDGSPSRSTNTHLTVAKKTVLGGRTSLDTRLTLSQHRLEMEYHYFTPSFFGMETFQSSAWEAAADLFHRPSEPWNLMAGLQYRAVQQASDYYDLPSFTDPSLVRQFYDLGPGDAIVTRAIYGQAQYRPGSSLTLLAGLRLEQMPRYTITVRQNAGSPVETRRSGSYDWDRWESIPQLALIWAPEPEQVLKVLYGKAVRRPSFFQNSKNSLDPSRQDLLPENIRTFETNYSVYGNAFTASLSLFRNTLSQLIVRVVRLDPATGEYASWSDNAGRMVTDGAEITLQYEPSKRFQVELAATVQHTEDRREEDRSRTPAFSPRHLAHLKVVWSLNPHATAALSARCIGAMEAYWDDLKVNADGSLGGRLGRSAPAYRLLDGHFRVRNVMGGRGFMDLRVTNLFNRVYQYPTFTNNSWADLGTPGPGRGLALKVGWLF